MLDEAGRDATESFEDVGHSDEAREIMSKLYVGDLKTDVSCIFSFFPLTTSGSGVEWGGEVDFGTPNLLAMWVDDSLVVTLNNTENIPILCPTTDPCEVGTVILSFTVFSERSKQLNTHTYQRVRYLLEIGHGEDQGQVCVGHCPQANSCT